MPFVAGDGLIGCQLSDISNARAEVGCKCRLEQVKGQREMVWLC